MPSAASRAATAFLDLFRARAPIVPPDLIERPELSAADYMTNREIYPVYPLSGWSAGRIIEMINSHDQGTFTQSELFYHALRKEGLIGAALEMFRESVLEFASTLQCPKTAPPEIHDWVEALARDWQSVMPDDVRGEIIERTRMFGFCICRLQWTWNNGQRQPVFIPFTHSSLSWRQDLNCYQAILDGSNAEGGGIKYVSNDGREWVIFSLGGTRPWLGGIIRQLAFVYFGIITGDDRWLNFNDKFAEPVRIQYTPRLTREQPEAQRMYQKVQFMRGGDLHLQPREGKDTGYDFRYEQVDARGFETLKEQLDRFDMRACIIILGHNLLQQVKGGSLAAMKEAKGLLRTKAVAALRRISTACEPLSKVWARANFGNQPGPHGRLPEQDTWSLIYDTSDPDLKELAAERAGKYADAFKKFFEALASAVDVYGEGPDQPDDTEALAADAQAPAVEGRPMPVGMPAQIPATPTPAFVTRLFARVDWVEAAGRCGLPMRGGEESYSQDDDDEAELAAQRFLTRGSRRLLAAPAASMLDGRFRIGPHGRSQRLKDLTGIASVAVFDVLGRLLMGRRRDSGKWTMPGGHLEPGEGAASGAARELAEEAGLTEPLEHIGSGTPGRGLLVHCFRCVSHGMPSSAADPDEEVETWEWMDLPLSADVLANLHAPRNVALALIGRPVGEVVIYERARVAALLSQ